MHVARQWMQRNASSGNKMFFKLDLENAFNSLDRSALLRAVRADFPDMTPWADWCYAHPSTLFCGQRSLNKEKGVQQGDPLGPLLVSLSIQPIIEKVIAEVNTQVGQCLDAVFFTWTMVACVDPPRLSLSSPTASVRSFAR